MAFLPRCSTSSRHLKKVGHVLFHPTASNVLATASADQTVKLWDITTAQSPVSFSGFHDMVQGLDFNYDGSKIVAVSRDKTIRIFDPRSTEAALEAPSHQGVKASRVVWLGNTNHVLTTGFSRSASREIFVWDITNLKQPIKQIDVDSSSGVLIPHFDADTNMLFVAGKGDGNIRFYEWSEEETELFALSGELLSTWPVFVHT